MSIIRMPTDYATRNGTARIALGLLQARLDHCRAEAQRTDELLRDRATEAGQSGSEHERVALEAAEWGMAYGYFSAILEGGPNGK
jgi:hypothetical protein